MTQIIKVSLILVPFSERVCNIRVDEWMGIRVDGMGKRVDE